MQGKILFLDDRWKEEGWKASFDQWLPAGVAAIYEEQGNKALDRLKENPEVKLVFLDLQFTGQVKQGEEILNDIKTEYPELPVIILTSLNDVQLALRLVHEQRKAYYFFFKDSIDADQIRKMIENAIEAYDLKTDSIRKTDGGTIVGDSPEIREVIRMAERASRVDSTVLITGESGTGKELVAHAIHINSRRSKGPFITVNCAAIAENLFEAELFGYEKGAFTDAIKSKLGRFEKADSGTIFLDEIADLPLAQQPKLLRALQFGEFEHIGGEKTYHADVRVIAATNRNPEEMVSQSSFREDLYYRLNVFRIHIPALRERKEDVPALASHILRQLAAKNGAWKELSEDALNLLVEYDWPGNIRQLQNVIEQSEVMSDSDTLSAEDLPHFLTEKKGRGNGKNIDVSSWISRVMRSDANWSDIKREFSAASESRREIVEGVIKSFKVEKGRRPTGDELAELFGIKRNYINQILNSLDVSLKAYD